LSGVVVSGVDLEAQACAINPTNNEIQFVVNTKGVYAETSGYPYLTDDCKSWLMKLNGIDRVLTSFPIILSGVVISGYSTGDDNLYSYDLDTDGRYTYISVIASGMYTAPVASGVLYEGDASIVEYYGAEWLAGAHPDNPIPSYLGNGVIGITPYGNNGVTVFDYYFRMHYSGPDIAPSSAIIISITHLTGEVHAAVPGGLGYNLHGMPPYDDFFNIPVNPTFTLDGITLQSFTNGGGGVGQGTPLYATKDLICEVPPTWIFSGEERWFVLEFSSVLYIVDYAQWQINDVRIRPVGTSGEADVVIWQPIPNANIYPVIRTPNGLDYEYLVSTPGLAKIELSKGSPTVLYGGNQVYNNGFVYYSVDGHTFNNLNLIDYGVLGNPALSGNAFVSDARNFDVVSGVEFIRYTGFVQHNLYNELSEVRLVRYDLNPVWSSPTLSGVCIIHGCLDHMETSNQGYLNTPYMFFSTISGNSYSNNTSEFYQLDKDQNYMVMYNNNLPASRVTIIRTDERV
jgi:hypothetical protein